jgi:chromosome segregation ATPase
MMANQLPSLQSSTTASSAHSFSSSNQFIYSFSDATSSYPTSTHESSSVNVVTPTHSRRTDDANEQLQLQLHHLRQQASQESLEYERAMRRAVLENEYVRKINVKLIAKLQGLEGDGDSVKSSLQMLDTVVQQSKQLMREMDESKREVVHRLLDAEGGNRQLTNEIEMASDAMRKCQLELEAIQSKSEERERRLEQMEVTSHQKDELVAELRDTLATSSHSYNKLRINCNTLQAEKENARLEVHKLLMEKDEDLLRRIDAEAHIAKSKRELGELKRRLELFEEAKLCGDSEHVDGGSETSMEEDWENRIEAVKAILKQATSERSAEVEGAQEEHSSDSQESVVGERLDDSARIRDILTAMDQISTQSTPKSVDDTSQNSQLTALAAENADLRNQISLLKGLQDFDSIQKAIAGITAERDELITKLEIIDSDTSAKIQEGRVEVNQLKEEIATVTKKLQTADAAAISLSNQLLSTESERDDLKGLLLEFHEHLLSMAERNEFSLKESRFESRGLEPSSTNDDDLKSDAFMEPEAEICEHKSIESDVMSAFQAIQSRLVHLEQSLDCEQKRVEQHDLEKAKLEGDNNAKIYSLTAQLNEYRERISNLEATNEKLVKSKQRLTLDMEERSAMHDHAQLEFDQASEFLNEIKMQLAAKSSALDLQSTEQKQERERLESTIASLEHDREQSALLVADLNNQLREVQKVAYQMKERVQMLEVDRALIYATKNDEITSVKQLLKEEKDNSKTLKEQLQVIRIKLDQSSEMESMWSDRIKLLQQNSELAEKHGHKCEELTKLNSTIEHLQSEVNSYKVRLSSAYEKVEAQNKLVTVKRKNISALQDEIISLSFQNDEIKSNITRHESSLRSICSSGPCQSKLTFDEMLLQLKRDKKKQQEKLEATLDENDILEQQVHILSTEVSKCKRERKELLLLCNQHSIKH